MVKILDPTAAFATVVTDRRRDRAAIDGERFRLGVDGIDCAPVSRSQDRSAVIGASAWALKAEQVEETVEFIGIIGGLLADMGFRVCPIAADEARQQRPTLVVWVCGNSTRSDEFDQLAEIGAPGLSIGSCVEGLDEWTYIDSEDLDNRDTFRALVAQEVDWLLAPNEPASDGSPSTATSTVPPDIGECEQTPAGTSASRMSSSETQSATQRHQRKRPSAPS